MPYEPDRDVFGNLWQLRRATTVAERLDETDHIPLRDADRDGGDRAAGDLRRRVDWQPAARARRCRSREGNLEVAEQVASQLKLYIDNNARILRSVGEELSGT